MEIQADKLPKIINWDCEHPGYPAGYVVQYRGEAHQVIDCRAEGQGYRLAGLSCPECTELRTRAESAESENAALREQIGEVKKHPMGQSVLRIIEAAPHHPDCQLQTGTGLWRCHPLCRAILDKKASDQ